MKNPAPWQIALAAAILVALSVLAFLLLYYQYSDRYLNFLILGGTTFFSFISAFLLFLLSIQLFIYRRIKLVYKNIHEMKAPEKEKSGSMTLNQNLLDEVEQEVMEWAADKKKEIEDLQKLESYRREFIGNISHELKTPIFNLQGYIHTLIDGGIEDEKINLDYLYKAARNLDRLNSIVEDLETISLLEAGKLTLEMQNFDIYKLTQEVFESLEMQADAFDITLEFQEDSDPSTIVYADKERIRQVMVNLISNSIKYGRDGGETKVGFFDMDKNIMIEVADNGIGVEKSELTRLFERFYRVDRSRSRDRGGTGLGLSIVKHIIEAHHQTITVRSTKGIGSTFAFTLKKGR